MEMSEGVIDLLRRCSRELKLRNCFALFLKLATELHIRPFVRLSSYGFFHKGFNASVQFQYTIVYLDGHCPASSTSLSCVCFATLYALSA
jgi:hypothetical protein